MLYFLRVLFMTKNFYSFVFFSLFTIFIFFQCSDLKNPYLNSSSSKAALKKLSVWEGDTVEIFSHDSIAVDVYLREHLSHYSLNIDANRYWKDTSIDASNFNKTQTRYPISFYDTGWHDLILTSYRLNGDSISESIHIYAKSPLKQNPLEINAGDTVTFSTSPLSDDVFYIWDLHNNTVIKDYKSTTKYYFEKAPSSSIGELYAADKNDHQSPKTYFTIKSSKIADVAVKWFTNDKNIPDRLFVGDTLNCLLLANPLSNLHPFNYKVELVDLNKVIHDSKDSIFLWVPTMTDTGNHQIKFIITDNKSNSDSFTDNITITPDIANIRFEQSSSADSEFIAPNPITVILSKVMKYPITVNYYIDWQQSTAQISDISSSISGKLTFNPGDTVKNIAMSIVNDNLNEYDENVVIRLSNPSNNVYLETQSTFTYTILDDDYVTYSFSNSQGNGNEAVRSCSVSVSISKPCISVITLQCKVDTLYSTASPSDYTFSTQTINIAPGQTTAMVHFQIKENELNGFTKVVAFRLSSLTSQNIRPGNILLYRYNIDGRWPSILIDLDKKAYTVNGEATDLTIQLNTNTDSWVPISVYFEVDHSLSTADSGSDYIILDKSPITFEPHTWSKSFIVHILENSIAEPDKKIVINFIKTSQSAILTQDSQQLVITINKNQR